MNPATETLVILDFGSQYTQLIARRVRELGVFSVILPYNAPTSEITQHQPKGIILSGGPASVYDAGAPGLNERVLSLNVPILGICYGLQLLARELGGVVEPSRVREYGKASLRVQSASMLLPDDADDTTIWMSHGVHVAQPPDGFVVTGMSGDIIAAIEDAEQRIFGLQFHPEVAHSERGKDILQNFLNLCDFSGEWTPSAFIATELTRIRDLVGDAQVVCALSGGVDSSVAASLVNRAIGKQQTCIFVDTGLLRKDEYEEVLAIYKAIDLNVTPVHAASRFLNKLKGVTDPETKRKIIGAEFIAIFDEEAKKIGDRVQYLVQGTLYPDVIESVSVNGPSHTIKSHHNVGGLPKDMKLKLLEPLRELFKDEVRAIGAELGLPQPMVQRQPFPGPGLGIRILGEVNEQQVALLQAADAIVREEIDQHPVRAEVWQFFAVLLPVKAVGVMGDGRTYEQVIAIRAIESTDGMTGDWARLPHDLLARISSRIVSEVKGVNRVVYDITSKPPGTIEWE